MPLYAALVPILTLIELELGFSLHTRAARKPGQKKSGR